MENTTVARLACSQLIGLSPPDPTNESSGMTVIAEAQAQCQLDAFMTSFSPFISLVKGLLNYGTVIIVVAGILLNGLSFVVLTRKGMNKPILSMFLSVLAVYDTLTLTLNFMIGVIRGQNLEANKSFQDSEHLCKLHGVFVEVFNLLSVWTIVTFTLQRYFVVKFPLKASLFTLRKTRRALAGVSLAIVVFSCHKIFITGFEGDSVFGYIGCQTNRIQLPEIIYFYVAFGTWLPTTIITVFNCAIIWELKKHQAKRQALTKTDSKGEKKATKLLLTVSSTYLILVLPLGIVQTIELFWNANVKLLYPSHVSYVAAMIVKYKLKWIRAFFFFFYQINFAVNFFLYVFSSSGVQFRHNLRSLFGISAGISTSERSAGSSAKQVSAITEGVTIEPNQLG